MSKRVIHLHLPTHERPTQHTAQHHGTHCGKNRRNTPPVHTRTRRLPESSHTHRRSAVPTTPSDKRARSGQRQRLSGSARTRGARGEHAVPRDALSEAGGRRLFSLWRARNARPEAGAAVLKYMQVRRVRASPHRWAVTRRWRYRAAIFCACS
jgi:hypothetical protein